MGDECCFRQARGARGEHEAERAFAVEALAQRARRVRVVRRQGPLVDSPILIDQQARQTGGHGFKAADAVELRQALIADEEGLALRARANRVQQGRPDDVRVDQCRYTADLGKPEPEVQKLRPVL